MDAIFGRGRWRPLERFQIVQADNKKRMIDNARRTEHNSHTSMSETIFTVSVDFVASVASSLARRLLHLHPDQPLETLDWFRMRLGTDDLPDAYRGLPVLPAHQGFSTVAIYVPRLGWRFTILWGLAFGLESAVVSFNRFPQLGVAISRRCTLAMTAAYFDDELAVEAVADADVSQSGLRLAFRLMGAPPQPEKGFVPTANRHYLGTSLHTGEVTSSGFVRVQPKYSTLAKVTAKLDSVLALGQLPRDDAGKLRGDVNWLFTMCMGHLGKIAGPALASHQHCDDPALTETEVLQLSALRQAVLASRPRDIPVLPRASRVTCVYSDASFEDGVLRLGWVIMAPERPVVGGADVLWFIDIEAAAAALIRASTAEADVLSLVQQAHLQFHDLRIRPWFEWIDTESNPADGLSREGISDAWTLQKLDITIKNLIGPNMELLDEEKVLAEENIEPGTTLTVVVVDQAAEDEKEAKECLALSNRSGHCRTSTASPRCQGTAGLQPRAPDPSGHCRTSTGTARSQWALLDFNRNCQIAVGTAGLQPQWALPDFNREPQIPVGTAGLQP
eukprot:s583_g29.t1